MEILFKSGRLLELATKKRKQQQSKVFVWLLQLHEMLKKLFVEEQLVSRELKPKNFPLESIIFSHKLQKIRKKTFDPNFPVSFVIKKLKYGLKT